MDQWLEWLRPAYIWLIAGLVLLLMEMAAPGVLLVFFSIGAAFVGVLCFIVPLSPVMQVMLFLVVSVLSLILLRKRFQKIFSGRLRAGKDMDDSTEGFVGEKAVVIKAISRQMAGQVELHGTLWEAEADEDIPKGIPVRVTEKDNLTLRVEKIQ